MHELKSKFDEDYKNVVSGQKLGKPQPAIQKPYPENAELITVSKNAFEIKDNSLLEAIKNRKSRRKFTSEFLTLDELSFLLWATQGIKNENNPQFKTVPYHR